MLCDVIVCEQCGAEAIRSVARFIYPPASPAEANTGTKDPDKIEFKIDCPNCGVTHRTEPFPPRT